MDDLTDAELALRPHRVRGAVAEILLDRAAIAPRQATVYAPQTRAARRELARLRDDGVVKSTADGRLWFDLRHHDRVHRHRQRIRGWVGAGVALVLALTSMLFYQG